MRKKITDSPRFLFAIGIFGSVLPLLAWLVVKYIVGVSDRYLPSPLSVLTAFRDIEPSVFDHTAATSLRILVSGSAGVILGIAVGICMHAYPALSRIITPTVQSFRSVPAVATVPFFLLWFGFAESGKFILIVLGIGLNVAVAAHHVLQEMPEKYRVALLSYDHSPRSFPIAVSLRLVAERILPTLRTSVSIAFGVVIVAELLGSQVGLGYLIQTSRTTYAIHVIFLATLILGLLNLVFDRALIGFWTALVYWNRRLQGKEE